MRERPSWVLDTNVVVSGLLSATGPPGRLIDMVLAQELMLTLDDRIEAEYREVLSRPRFCIDSSRREAFFAVLVFQDLVTAGPCSLPSLPDEDDMMFLEVASRAGSQVLVTGNLRHFPANCRGSVEVLSPAKAWERFAKQERL